MIKKPKINSISIQSMVGTVEARKLNFSSFSSSSNSKVISSLLYEPTSQSLALMHSDASFSLISPFFPFSSSIFPQTLIPPFNSAACFVQIDSNPNCPDGKGVVFVTSGPYNGGSKVVLRFYVLGKGGNFVNVEVGCSQNGVCFDRRIGVVVDVNHGMKVMLSGSVNYFAMYSFSAAKVMVFGVRFVGEKKGLRLVKCAVIDCQLPLFSIGVSFGFLVLGELKGVRIFPLRALVKGKVGSMRKSRVARWKVENSNGVQQEEVRAKLEARKLKLPNGVVRPFDERVDLGKHGVNLKSSMAVANGHAYNMLDGLHPKSADSNHHDTVKRRSLKLLQDSGEWGMQFVSFNDSVDQGANSKVPGYKTTKAVFIQAMSSQKFLVVDSNGDMHILHVSKCGSTHMRLLPGTIPVHQLATFPDAYASSCIVWISDGLYSVHLMMLPGSDATDNEDKGNNADQKIIFSQSQVTRAIFTSENIQDMIAVAANTVLILGQESLYAYAIS